jgi:predicted glycosyltransferase
VKILIDINHPAHVHFFRNFIFQMKAKGHEILVIANSKDISIRLLELYKIDYINMGSYGKTLFQKATTLLWHILKVFKIFYKFRPHVVMGIGSPRICPAALLFRAKSMIFTDTEHAKEQIILYKYFADHILTPECFTDEIGPTQIKYPSYHELAYLHPNQYRPNETLIEKIKSTIHSKIFVLRFVSWDATHDIGQSGFDYETKNKLVKYLSEKGKVLISVEGSIPDDLQAYSIKIRQDEIFEYLYLADLYVGEGATMATEASLLGTPSIFMSTLKMGVQKELEEKYQVQFSFQNPQKAFDKVVELLNTPNLKGIWQERRTKLLKERIDATEFIIDFVNEIG